MEGYADQSMCFSGENASAPDPREAKYQLAGRLVDNIRYGEALRILETLGDYRDSRELLAQVRALKAYIRTRRNRRSGRSICSRPGNAP